MCGLPMYSAVMHFTPDLLCCLCYYSGTTNQLYYHPSGLTCSSRPEYQLAVQIPSCYFILAF